MDVRGVVIGIVLVVGTSKYNRENIDVNLNKFEIIRFVLSCLVLPLLSTIQSALF